jgi:dolichol kinase
MVVVVERFARKHSSLNVETLLWLSLGVLTFIKTWHWMSLIPIVHVLLVAFVLPTTSTTSDPPNVVVPVTYNHETAASGNAMSIVLTPSLFLSVDKPVYALFASGMAVLFLHLRSITTRILPLALSFTCTTTALLWTSYIMNHAWLEPELVVIQTIVVATFLWFCIQRFQNVPGGSFSSGEWLMVSTLLAVSVTEGIINSTKNVVTEQSLFAYTAIAGLCGCTVAVTSVDRISRTNVMIRLIYIAIVPLGTVELFFFWYHHHQNNNNNIHHKNYPFPKCLFWIFGDFLVQVEDPQPPFQRFITMMNIPNHKLPPRMAWLVYWGITMTATIPLAPGSNAHPILSRKWFHWIAILLFVPGTIMAPQLQSLSYAVALAVLLVLESTRHLLPWLNEFYKTYLDSSKNETESSTIVSHMALIVGCATPLWISQWISMSSSSVSTTSSLLLPLWGVWTLGIADAMGAIVGKNWGRIHWGTNHRTVEGSCAMLISLCIACHITCSYESGPLSTPWTVWVPAAFFVTLLEAFTTQIDNLVLPLAGTVVLSLLLL